MSPPKPRVLVIAGSDSSGGAGLEADQRVLALHNVYALTATTALTAQNTSGVSEIHAVPPSFVEACIEAVWDDFELDPDVKPGLQLGSLARDEASGLEQQTQQSQRSKLRKRSVDVVKIGMLHSAATIQTVARVLAAKRASGYVFDIVLDPVMKATSGAVLLASSPNLDPNPPGTEVLDPVAVLRNELLPLADIVTPNIPEALLLASETFTSIRESINKHDDGSGRGETQSRFPPKTRDDVIQLAREVAAACARGSWVLIKGGHFAEQTGVKGNEANEVVDILLRRPGLNKEEQEDKQEEMYILTHPHLSARNTHGTGCSLASAIAANLALGCDMPTAVRRACGYVQAAITSAAEWDVGRCGGGIDHWAVWNRESGDG